MESSVQQRAEQIGGFALHVRQGALLLQVNTIGEREFGRPSKAANVRRIRFHGLRHTVATLMLSAGVPAHVVQRRLGHAEIEMTFGIYARLALDAAGCRHKAGGSPPRLKVLSAVAAARVCVLDR